MTVPLIHPKSAPPGATATDPVHIELSGVSKKFSNGAQVLENINLRVQRESFVSLVGPSGCGKSTLLKLVAGLSSPNTGRIRVDTKTPIDARATMSFIFQDATLLPWRTVIGNVQLGLELEGTTAPHREQTARELLALVGLEAVGDRYPRQLSGGMRMRVSIARALATTPHLLLMDEPFGALDEITRNRLNEELLNLREREGWTALFVTHSVAEAVFLSSRIVVFGANPGRIMQDLDVPFPYPRTDALRGSDAFGKMVLEVSRALREAEGTKVLK